MDPNLYHTLPGGVEVRVIDILVMLINGFIIGAILVGWLGYRIY